MTEKEFVKAKVAFNKIKELDKEIIRIERLIIDSIENTLKHSILLKSVDHNVDKVMESSSSGRTAKSIDMNSFFSDHYRNMMNPFFVTEPKEDKKETSNTYSLSSSEYVNVLSVIINSKKSERQHLIDNLNELGIKI